MALIQRDFFSETLGCSTALSALVPDNVAGCSALYLLHGRGDDHTSWQTRTQLERYVSSTNLAVIMPNVARSFCTDMHDGGRYFTFVTEELPALVKRWFCVSPLRDDTYVAGFSMGGYSALRLAMQRPNQFAAAAAFAPVTDLLTRYVLDAPEDKAEWRRVFGEPKQLRAPQELFALAREFAHFQGQKPRLYHSCGGDDFLYDENLRFQRHAQELGISLTWEARPGLTHNWAYCDQELPRALEWMGFLPNA